MATNYYVKDSMNRDIKNHEGDNLGHVEDMVLTPEGQAEYIIISYGGIFGTELNDKLVAVPYNQFGWDEQEDCLKLPLDKRTLEEAPNFDKNHVPSLKAEAAYFASSRDYYAKAA